MKVRQVTLRAPDTNEAQNFTVSGFGTPQAAIIMSSWSADSTWQNGGNIGLGFWDGTNQNVCGAGWQHGGTPGSSNSRHYSDAALCVWAIVVGSSSDERKAAITDTITDGIELTWTGSSPANARPYVTVILMNGLNGVQTGHRTASKSINGETETATAGITPKLILLSGRRSDTATGGSNSPGWWTGFACYNGSSINQGCVAWRNTDGNPTDCNGSVRNDYCITSDMSTGGLVNGPIEMTAMESGSFTTTTRVNAPIVSSHFYLALDFDESVVGWDAETPTSSGDFDPYTASFTPQWAFMFPTGFASINTSYGGDQDGPESMQLYSVVDETGEEASHCMTMENDSTVSLFSQSRYDNRLEINEVTSTPTSDNLVNGDSPTFDPSGIVYADIDFTHDAASGHQIIGFFVEEEDAPVGGVSPMPVFEILFRNLMAGGQYV